MKTKNLEEKIGRDRTGNRLFWFFYFIILIFCLLLVFGCGYRIIGSKYLPFDSIAIKPVQNSTYEPKLDERLHNALSREFIVQGIDLVSAGRADSSGAVPDNGIVLETRITTFELNTIAAVSEKVKEQEIIMLVDVSIIDKNRMTELKALKSPIQITYQATGSVSEALARKEKAIDKACTEIAKEVVNKVIIKYVK